MLVRSKLLDIFLYDTEYSFKWAKMGWNEKRNESKVNQWHFYKLQYHINETVNVPNFYICIYTLNIIFYFKISLKSIVRIFKCSLHT